MAELPKFFPPTPPAAIATFNYTDIADGTGVVVFLPTASIDSSGTTYQLVTNNQPSALRSIVRGSLGSTNLNFDLTAFNTPRTVKGTATLSIALGAENAKTCKVSAQIQKLDTGNNETNVSSIITSNDFIGNTSNGELAIQLLMQIPLTETNFSQGDKLRLNLILTQSGSTGDGTEMGIDPAGRISIKTWITSSNFTTTKTQLNMPFKLLNL